MNNFLKSILFLSTALAFSTATAQQKEFIVKSKLNSDRSVAITAEKNSPGTYTVVLNFKELSNTSSVDDPVYKVKHSGDNFLTLTPDNKNQSIVYSYSYSYIRGELNPKYNPHFLYTLPYANGTKIRTVESTYMKTTYFGSTTPADWKSYRFSTEQQDTVTAVRKGLVVNVNDAYEENSDIKYTTKTNSIIIEHEDGTLATYRGFKKGIFVKEGQTVFPSTPLGMNSLGTKFYGISLMITYLKSAEFGGRKQPDDNQSKSFYGFITPYFCTAENANGILSSQKSYTAAITPEIIQKEMTKKEIKNFGKK